MAAFNDPDFPNQWQLQAANCLNLYDEYSGRGVRIGQIDTRRWPDDPELEGQLDLAAGVTARDTSQITDLHGQQVAELLVGKANNGVAGIGAAFDATLVAYTFDMPGRRTVAQEAELLALQAQVDISHNSWSHSGYLFRDNFADPAYADAAASIARAAAEGRGGLGTVFVRSAGNARQQGDDVNTHSYANDRYTITVGAAFENGDVAPMSNPGAALLLVAPGTATSWAAPMATGTIALMLEANPSLGYRDVQSILALSARMSDVNAGWFYNAADGWNGGGMHVSRRAGFGMIDAHAAVRLAESWDATSTNANLVQASAGNNAGAALADNARLEQSVTIGRTLEVERAELSIDLRHERIGDLRITLISPSGTESLLLDRPGLGNYDPASGALVFTMSSTQFLGEAAQGAWRLRVEDLAAGSMGTLVGWSLTVLGAEASDDTRYVFTDEYGSLGMDPARRVLQDTAGEDTINGAALMGAARIDLSGAEACRIAGRSLTLDANTVIEHAISGDGDDWLTGNGLDNRLVGGRGNDRLEGGEGNDILDPGQGRDEADGGAGHDTVPLSLRLADYAAARHGEAVSLRSLDGTVILRQVEQLDFADGAVLLGSGGPLFDALFYAANTPGALADGSDMLAHYKASGWREGHDPNALLGVDAYLARNPDVAAAGTDPMAHYAAYGWREGRDPSPLFDIEAYLARNPDVAAAGTDPLGHYLSYGQAEGRSVAPAIGAAAPDGFDAGYYLLANRDVARAGLDALGHWNNWGRTEQRDPNGYFDVSFYMAHSPDVAAAGVDPLAHYNSHGWHEGRAASAAFDTDAYLTANPDVAAAGVNPLLHFLHYGAAEGRLNEVLVL